ncbi:hypothetical protein HDU92_000501 [Lobulomyces angularis]|nr:hypothetical protein HDU92_000501 [Lobulomyces angularis]
MSLIGYNPTNDFFNDPFFQDDFFNPYGNRNWQVGRRNWPRSATNQLSAPLDIWEEGDVIKGRIDVPGFSKDNVKAELINGNTLKISGERKEENVKENSDNYFSERKFGSFSRTVTLPSNVDESQLCAKLDNGVLQLEMKKAPSDKIRKSIKIN